MLSNNSFRGRLNLHICWRNDLINFINITKLKKAGNIHVLYLQIVGPLSSIERNHLPIGGSKADLDASQSGKFILAHQFRNVVL